MKKMFFNLKSTGCRCISFMIAMISSLAIWGQTSANRAVEELINNGFENVRWKDTDNERIYTIENNVYKTNGVGHYTKGRDAKRKSMQSHYYTFGHS